MSITAKSPLANVSIIWPGTVIQTLPAPICWWLQATCNLYTSVSLPQQSFRPDGTQSVTTYLLGDCD
ncbi:Hypothetical protein NTJ_07572 [Nesidiocoris tenuis]|uniref:Uncharacterized protein n=1 Tax=Nesidiocoris tenuis TaxID=355587 RepID=A0ABN7AS44_9HEMI|nr:Hypothetical protein NTJ_07572 [Nesidiocoris tenuis]